MTDIIDRLRERGTRPFVSLTALERLLQEQSCPIGFDLFVEQPKLGVGFNQ